MTSKVEKDFEEIAEQHVLFMLERMRDPSITREGLTAWLSGIMYRQYLDGYDKAIIELSGVKR